MQDLQEVMSQGSGALLEDDTLVINVGTALSSKSKNLFLPGTDALGNTVLKDYGRGAPIGAFAQITAAAVGTVGTTTLQLEVITADDQALSVNVNSLLKSAAVAVAALVAGYKFRLGTIPEQDPGQAANAGGAGAVGSQQQFMGFRYTVGGANMTGGLIRCWFGPKEALAAGLGGPV